MFLLDDDAIATMYTLSFVVGLAVPGWRSLIATGCIALAVAALANATAHGGIAATLTLIGLLTAVGALCCGLLTRAVTLWVAPLRKHPYRFIIIAVIGYIVPTVAYSGPKATMAWLRRPSLEACSEATYRVMVANMTLQVKAAPSFSISLANRAGSPYARFLAFGSTYGIKEICGRGLRDHQIIAPAAIHLSRTPVGPDLSHWAHEHCTATRNATLLLVCRLADKNDPVQGLDGATIYGPEMDANILHSGAYAVEKQLNERLLQAGEPFVQICDGDDGSSLAFYCAAQETAPNGIRIKFRFRTNGKRLVTDSDAIRAYLHELVASFSEVSASPGSSSSGL